MKNQPLLPPVSPLAAPVWANGCAAPVVRGDRARAKIKQRLRTGTLHG